MTTAKLTKSSIIRGMCELADAREQIPTHRQWDDWDERPCSSGAVMNRFGSWDKALAAAGLPRYPPGAPQSSVRSALYRKHIEMKARGVP